MPKEKYSRDGGSVAEGKYVMIKQRILGRTGLRVGEVGIGCEGFSKASEESSYEMMSAALANGMNYIDIYASDPKIRSNIGYAIRGRREQVLIQAHVGTIWMDGQYKRTRDLQEAKEGFADLLERLGTDYIDVGMIHYCDEQKDFERIFHTEFIEYVKELKVQGKIHHIGISSHNPEVALRAVETGLIDVLMFSVNPCYDMLPPSEDVEMLWADESYEKPLFNMEPSRQNLYETCERENIAISVMKAFAGGDLLDDKLSPFGVAMTPAQCIHYCLTRPGVAVVMAGAHNIEEVLADAAYGEATDAEKDYAPALNQNPKFTFAGHCMYCGHCAPCAKKIEIAYVNKYLDLCIAQGEVPETVREHYLALEHHGGECIECGRCEKNCPFGVKIMEKMKQASRIFGC
ncbi:MAG: aldo/keto reductase [Faecalimonas sp.]|nr:aldo/keto reductase [Faecalimonas sp.]